MLQRPLVRRPSLSSSRCSASCARRCAAAMPPSPCRQRHMNVSGCNPKCCRRLAMGSCDAAAEHVARSRSTERKSSSRSVKVVRGDSRRPHGASADKSAAATGRSRAHGDRRRGGRRLPSIGGARGEASDEHDASVDGDAGNDTPPVQPRGWHHRQEQTPHAMQWPSGPPQCEHEPTWSVWSSRCGKSASRPRPPPRKRPMSAPSRSARRWRFARDAPTAACHCARGRRCARPPGRYRW